MARKKLDFTLEEINEELILIVTQLDAHIREAFGENFYRASLGSPLLSYEANIYPEGKDLTYEDIKDTVIVRDIALAYEYAQGHVYPDMNIPESCLENMSLPSRLIEGVFYIKDSKCEFLNALTDARLNLDIGERLNIKEIALLAGVDERTIRNSASSKEANTLITDKLGGNTLIENDEAKRWLATRPGFKATKYIGKNMIFDTPRYFNDEVGFGKFITYCMKIKGISAETVAKDIEVSTVIIENLEKGIDNLYLGQVSQLADILEENKPEFVKDYMRIFHIEELADLLGVDCTPSANADDPKESKAMKLMGLKSQLDFESQYNIIQRKNDK